MIIVYNWEEIKHVSENSKNRVKKVLFSKTEDDLVDLFTRLCNKKLEFLNLCILTAIEEIGEFSSDPEATYFEPITETFKYRGFWTQYRFIPLVEPKNDAAFDCVKVIEYVDNLKNIN